MLKLFRTTLVIIVCCFALLRPVPILAQSHTQLDIQTDPAGASVAINGQPVGVSPLSLQVAPGAYTLEFSLPGFPERVEQHAIFGRDAVVYADMRSLPVSDDFIRLSDEALNPEWGNGNQLRFELFRRPDTYTYDVDQGTFLENPPFLNISYDAPLQSALRSRSALFSSPSRRYMSYVTHDNRISVFDTNRNQHLPTEIEISDVDEVRFVWSRNESVLWVEEAREKNDFLILTQNGEHDEVLLWNFKSETGEDVYLDRVLARPSDQGLILVFGHPGEGCCGPYFWLVNLKTLTGKPLPFENILAVSFSLDGHFVYVAQKDQIFRTDLAFQEHRVISTAFSTLNNVYQVTFSYTLDYALVVSNNTEAPLYWIYRLPRP